MKLAIIVAEAKPVPAVEGGAVETIIDTFVKYNEIDTKLQIDIYSKYNINAMEKLSQFKYTNGNYIKIGQNIISKVWRKLRRTNFKKEYIKKVMIQMKNKKYDWILIENRPEFVLPLRTAFRNSKIALHMHNEHLSAFNESAKNIIHATNRIITVSDFIAKSIKKLDPNQSEKVLTLINKIDINQFKPAAKREDLCKKFQIDNKTVVIVFHGRIVREKGVLEAIKAYNNASNVLNNLKMIIIGNLKTVDKDYRQLIENEVDRSRDNHSVVFTGYVPHENIPDYLNLGDILLLPSKWNEPCALSIIEALAIGRPLISTNTGGTPEIVHGDSGILVTVNQNLVHSLTNNIIDLSSDKIRRINYGRNARSYALEHFDDRTFLKELLSKLDA